MIPTLRVYGLLGAGLAIALVLSLLGLPLLGLAIGLLGFDAIVLAVAFWDSRRVERAIVEQLPIARLSIGRDNPIAIQVRSGLQPAELQLRAGHPEDFMASLPLLQTRLPSHSSQELSYSVNPPRRGEFTWNKLAVRQLSPWQLAWQGWTVPGQPTVAVYPDLIGLRSLTIRLTLQTNGNLRRARQLGIGTEFAELREYATGDDPRLIDWNATARRSRLSVRVLEPEQEQTLIVLLDRGRLMTAQVQGLARFDWGLNATLALALAGLQRGDRVGVGVFDRQLHTWLPPERGQTHLAKLIDRLTPIQPELLEPDYVGAVTTLAMRQTRRALVVLITEVIDATASIELLAAMGQLAPRHLPFCVTLRDPQVDRQAQQRTQDVATTYRRAVALDLLSQRQLALGKLKQKGVLVLDAPAHQISDELVDRYLQLKARSQL
jgi:uncharacterized protein (DUF58 family)